MNPMYRSNFKETFNTDCHTVLMRPLNHCQIKSNQFISETADSKVEIQDNDNVQPLTTEVRKGCYWVGYDLQVD